MNMVAERMCAGDGTVVRLIQKDKRKLTVRQRPPLAEVFSPAYQNSYCTLDLGKFVLKAPLKRMACYCFQSVHLNISFLKFYYDLLCACAYVS